METYYLIKVMLVYCYNDIYYLFLFLFFEYVDGHRIIINASHTEF